MTALFANAPEAVAWAEEYTARPKVRSQMASIMSVTRKRSGMSPQDWMDLALSVTNAVCGCQQPMATVYRALYGGRAVGRDDDATGCLAGHLFATVKMAGYKRDEQIYGLCAAVLRDERLRIVMEHSEGRYRLTMDQFARAAMVSRQQFSTSKAWPNLLIEARNLLATWRNIAENELTEKLSDMGMFSDDELYQESQQNQRRLNSFWRSSGGRYG